eukprot:g188.t1
MGCCSSAETDALSAGNTTKEAERASRLSSPLLNTNAAGSGDTAPRLSEVFDAGMIRTATNDFAEANKVDEGSFGVVYRGMLRDGRRVAVKMLKFHKIVQDRGKERRSGKRSKYSGEESFRREAEVLAQIRHTNIVALLGHCLDADECLPCLVYEFMAGKSLRARLRAGAKAGKAAAAAERAPPGGGGGGGAAAQPLPLPLSGAARIAVASDVARGLAFLHSRNPTIIHQDVKSDNVLLAQRDDGSVHAKLADFGTVRIAPTLMKHSHVTTVQVVGTSAYMPYEYRQSGHVSAKTDAYAFGVVLLELLTGQPARERAGGGERRRRGGGGGGGKTIVARMERVLERPQDLLTGALDVHAGGWAQCPERAFALAAVAKRCTEQFVQRRCAVADVLPDVDALAGRAAVPAGAARAAGGGPAALTGPA